MERRCTTCGLFHMDIFIHLESIQSTDALDDTESIVIGV